MEQANKKFGWVLFSMFVWLHLIQSLYPLPWHRSYESMAEDAITTRNSLLEKGFNLDDDEYAQLSKNEWETALTTSYWYLWLRACLLIFLGFISSFFLYKNYKIWPICLFIVTTLFILSFIYPFLELDSPFLEWFRFIKLAYENSYYLHTYNASIWPLYLFILLIFSVHALLKRE